tara:strand:- start:481 stop:2226 length:1746 start_codon:yes stop_codon:yes gene_type:complete
MKDIKDFINMTSLYNEYTLLEATSQELAKDLYDAGAGKVFGTDEEAIFALLDQIKSKEEFDAVVDEYRSMARGDGLVDDLQGEMSGQELATLNSVLDRVSADDFGNEPGSPADMAARAAITKKMDQDNTAEPEVTGSGRGDGNAEVAQRRRDAATGTTDTTTVDPNRPGGNNNPFKNTTDRYAWINAGRPDIWPPEAEPAATAEPEVKVEPEEVDDTPKITAEIQVELEKRGLDKGIIGEPLTPEDIAALEQPAPTRPPAAPSGLSAKLGQITAPNLMKAYNDAGKQPMDQVKSVQTALSRLGFDPNGLDGKYGPGTFKAVQAFQKANGLAVDGQIGPNTIKAMVDKLGGTTAPAPQDELSATDQAQSGVDATQQNASKDNNMNRNKINEASMNISMNGDGADEVAALVKLLQNAGMSDAAPVSDIPMPMQKALPAPTDGHDDMKAMMSMVSEPMDGAEHDHGTDCGCDTCGESSEEYDAVVSEWDNSPEEEYKDHSYMTKDLSGGINREKKQFAKANDGDNAMAVEAIKEALWAALQEKSTTEGRGRGKKMKLKASRGNEDIKTTEGSRGKKSRGKKSRG